MNQYELQIMGIYGLVELLEDTLEYGLPDHILSEITHNGGHDYTKYQIRQEHYKSYLDPSSPIMIFCGNNFSNKNIGADLIKKLVDIGAEVYDINSSEKKKKYLTIIEKGDEKVVIFERKYVCEFYDTIIGMHEIMTDLCRSYLQAYGELNAINSSISELFDKTERYYRNQAMFILLSNVTDLYASLGQHISKVLVGVAEEDISEVLDNDEIIRKYEDDISSIIANANFVLAHNTCQELLFLAQVDKYEEYKEYVTRAKPLPEGQTFADIVNDFQYIFQQDMRQSSIEWKECYDRVSKELSEKKE